MNSGIVISGVSTSIGKSSISIGLMRLLKRRGHCVKPFKVGPDYIDPGHHYRAAGNPSYNLDSWMSSPGYIKQIFDDVVKEEDIAIVEGVMGLFDGAYSTKPDGTTAEVAKTLGLPVLLVAEGQYMARSFAALVQGFTQFDSKLEFIGVLANRVNTKGHMKILKESIEHYANIPFLGAIPSHKELEMPSRYLGLHLSNEQEEIFYEQWANHLEDHLDISALFTRNVEKTPNSFTHTYSNVNRWNIQPRSKKFKVAIAKDEAFQFLYQDTLDFIQGLGGEIHFFSPLKDATLPANSDLIYFPGGYPELYAPQLSSNFSLRNQILNTGNDGTLIIGECGGLMYLGKSLKNLEGENHSMVGLFEFSTTMEHKKLTIGYRELEFIPNSQEEEPIVLKGHEFHNFELEKEIEPPNMKHRCPKTQSLIQDGYIYKNCFAFRSHIYWPSSLKGFKFLLSKIKN